MRRALVITALLTTFGVIEACNCGSMAGGDLDASVSVDGGDLDAYLWDHDGMFPPDFDVDAYIWDHDGMLPPGVEPPDLAPLNPDGGIVVKTPDGGTAICYKATCQGKLYACGDCLDNDNDGLVDSYDPDCLGPCQNNEGGFFGSIPGQNNAPCKSDCYWDQDTGSGNDDCSWSHSCDPNEAQAPISTAPEIGCTYDPDTKVPGASVPSGQKDCVYLATTQKSQCTSFCAPLTPNGCDCFGCCENPQKPGTFVFAGSVNAAGEPTCGSGSLNDPAKCKPCQPVAGACYKACGKCQLCFGKTSLPPECFSTVPVPQDGGSTGDGGSTTGDGGTGGTADGGASGGVDGGSPQQCPAGQQACGLPGQLPCGPGTYCITGCCVTLIF